jgi:hypothetical protein
MILCLRKCPPSACDSDNLHAKPPMKSPANLQHCPTPPAKLPARRPAKCLQISLQNCLQICKEPTCQTGNKPMANYSCKTLKTTNELPSKLPAGCLQNCLQGCEPNCLQSHLLNCLLTPLITACKTTYKFSCKTAKECACRRTCSTVYEIPLKLPIKPTNLPKTTQGSQDNHSAWPLWI